MASKLEMRQISALAANWLSTLDTVSIPSNVSPPGTISQVIYLSHRHLQKLCSLLVVFSEDIIPESDALTSCLYSHAMTCFSFLDFNDVSVSTLAWNGLTLIMKVNSEVVLGLMEQIEPKIHNATLGFLQVLIRTNFQLRNGVEFIKWWTFLLKAEIEKSSLFHPEVMKTYQPSSDELGSNSRVSEEAGKNLSSPQILELLDFVYEDFPSGAVLNVLKAILLGIQGPHLIDHVTSHIRDTFAPAVIKSLESNHVLPTMYEVCFLMLEVSDSLVPDLYSYKILRRALKRVQRSAELFPVRSRSFILIQLQCILRFKEILPKSKKIDSAFEKSLSSTLLQLQSNVQPSADVGAASIDLISALIKRWILLIK